MKTILLPLISLLTFTPLADTPGQAINTYLNIYNNTIYKGYVKTQRFNNDSNEGTEYRKITNTREKEYIKTQEENTYCEITVSSYTETLLISGRWKNNNENFYIRTYEKIDIVRLKYTINQPTQTDIIITNNVQNINSYGFTTKQATTWYFTTTDTVLPVQAIKNTLDTCCDTTFNTNQDLYDFWEGTTDMKTTIKDTGEAYLDELVPTTESFNTPRYYNESYDETESLNNTQYVIQYSLYESETSTEPLVNPDIDFLLNNQCKTIEGYVNYTIELEQITTVINYEVMDIPGLMFTILGMPFAFISTAFNLTLFAGTPYAINITTLFFTLIGSLIIIYVLKKVIK